MSTIPTVRLFVPKFGRVVTVNASDEAFFRVTYGAYGEHETPATESTHAEETEGHEEASVLTDTPAKPTRKGRKADADADSSAE